MRTRFVGVPHQLIFGVILAAHCSTIHADAAQQPPFDVVLVATGLPQRIDLTEQIALRIVLVAALMTQRIDDCSHQAVSVIAQLRDRLFRVGLRGQLASRVVNVVR
ncbi:hypothetical protein D3C71_1867950 [compost metagenome]